MALELEMTVEETHGPTSQEPVGSAKSYPMRVRLSAQSMGYQDADETWSLLDFPQRRRLRRNEAAKTYTSDSLFADVDARHIEAPNLAFVRSTIAAGGGDTTTLGAVFIEHQLSLPVDRSRTTLADDAPSQGLWNALQSLFKAPPKADIAVEVGAHETRYRASERLLLSHDHEGPPADPAMAERFVQLLRYRFAGHPLILERLARLGYIPRGLKLASLATVFDRTVSLHIDSVAPAEEGPPSLDGYRKVQFMGVAGPCESLLAQLPPSQRLASEQGIAAALEAMRQGRGLEGSLRFFELTLETGAALPPALAEWMKATTDPDVRALLKLLQVPPTSAEEARRAIAAYGVLRARAGALEHVLSVVT